MCHYWTVSGRVCYIPSTPFDRINITLLKRRHAPIRPPALRSCFRRCRWVSPYHSCSVTSNVDPSQDAAADPGAFSFFLSWHMLIFLLFRIYQAGLRGTGRKREGFPPPCAEFYGVCCFAGASLAWYAEGINFYHRFMEKQQCYYVYQVSCSLVSSLLRLNPQRFSVTPSDSFVFQPIFINPFSPLYVPQTFTLGAPNWTERFKLCFLEWPKLARATYWTSATKHHVSTSLPSISLINNFICLCWGAVAFAVFYLVVFQAGRFFRSPQRTQPFSTCRRYPFLNCAIRWHLTSQFQLASACQRSLHWDHELP